MRFIAKIIFGTCICVCSMVAIGVTQDRVTLSLNNASIMDLVQWAQDVTPKTIIVHPNVSGKITVAAGDPMTAGEAYQVFLSVLDVNGFTAIETEQAIKILPSDLGKQSAAPFISNEKNISPEDLIVKVVKINNVSANQLVSAIKPMIPNSGHLTAYAQTNSIIIADRAGNIKEVTRLIEQLDRVGMIDIDIISVKFAQAKEIANHITSLMPQNQGPESNPLKIAVDERSNSIMVTGDPYSRQQIKNLVERLDRPLNGQDNTQVIFLNYATASKIVPIISGVGGNVQKGEKDKAASDVGLNIQADDSLNALIVTAPPSLQASIKKIVTQLDVRRGQVLVEALIVEVNEDTSNSLGVEWKVPPSNGKHIAGGAKLYPSNLDAMTFKNGELNLGSGLSLGYLKGMDMRAVINALRGEANANILSTPTIMALDNEEAAILVGENVPFVTGSQKQSGDNSPFQTITRQDIGISLKIVPKINNDNSVSLDIEQKVESIGNTDAATADIITNKREIKTRVLIDDNQILALGGLMRDEITSSESKVPLLGSVPIIGRAFRSTTTSKIKRNLMVFIHPKILNDNSSASAISEERYLSLKKKQEETSEKMPSLELKQGPSTQLPPPPQSNKR